MKKLDFIHRKITFLFLICLLVFGYSCKKEIIEYSLNVNVLPVGNGTVSLSPSEGIYQDGTVVTLTPNAGSSNKFSSWSGIDVSYVADNKIIMSKNMEITANFEKLIQSGKWQGYYTVFQPTTYDIYFYINDNKITKIGSTIFVPGESYTCSMMLYLYFSNMYMTKFYYNDIQITNGSFNYSSGSTNTSGGQTTITGTFTSADVCTGRVVYNEGSNRLDYNFIATP